MTGTIVSAVITGAVTLSVCLINNNYQMQQIRETAKREAQNNQKKHDESIELITYKLDQLTKQVEKHNSVIERTYKLEERASVTEEMIRVANHRIEDLENI